MADIQCTWTNFYMAFADKLLEFKDDRPALIAGLDAAYESIDMKLPKLESVGLPDDIDPFTVFGLFNKGITEANRRKIIAALAKEFGVTAELPRDFDGIPVLNNLNATFYAFVIDPRRGEHDIDNLWRVFEAALALDANDNEATRSEFAAAYGNAVVQFTLGRKLSMGLYWARPFRFISLDSRNRWYLGDKAMAGSTIASVAPKERDAPIHDGRRYLHVCDTILSKLNTEECPFATFPALSHAAFVESARVNKEKKAAESGATVLKSKYIPLMKGLLNVLRRHGGELYPKDARELMKSEENFTEKDLTSGNALGWARNFLADAGYIDRSNEAKSRGVWILTEAGWSVDMTDQEASRVIRAKNAHTAARRDEGDNSLGDADVATVRYWLYAPGRGAVMWAEFYERGVMGLGWDELGDLSIYDSKQEIRDRLREIHGSDSSFVNSALATWQFVHELKPGDIIFAKRGMSEIIGRGIVEGDYEYDPEGGEYPHLRSVKWTDKGSWKSDSPLAMKTLTEVTDYTDFVTKTKELFSAEDEEDVEDTPAAEQPAYDKGDFLADVYMSESQYDTLVGVLRSKKNIILQGAPGVGKTFAAKRLAYSMMGVKDPERVMMVQFHQSYSYEDFIEGYRPSADGFELEKGAFYTFCKRAQDDSENDYFFIIDEINRGNLSKIFGELFMLIESDKRGPKNKLQLLYSRELFYVPGNVYLIGMMNTADRSLAMLDYALRRRFAFFDLRPGFDSDGFVAYRKGLESAKFDELVACVVRLNEAIAEDDTLGEGFCIGHSYFCGLKAEDVTDAKLSAIVEYELIPMLREYWFDEPSKVREWADALRRSVK